MDKIFRGDFSDLKEYITYQPNNKVKLLLGVRTTDENKQYQAYFTEMPMKSSVSRFDKLEKFIAERKDAGAYQNTEFEVCELKEFSNTPSAVPESSSATPSSPWFK